jgi:hypothetical protein
MLLVDPGLGFSVLSEFRDRLVQTDTGRRGLDGVLTDNDFAGNAQAATRFGTPPGGGRWRDNDE